MNANSPHFLGEVGQKALIAREGKVLMVHASDGVGWDFPGGKLHLNETTEGGLLRELKEELGITSVKVEKPLHAIVTTSKTGTPKLMIVYACALEDDSEFVLTGGEIEAIKWVAPGDVTTIETHPSWRKVLQEYFQPS